MTNEEAKIKGDHFREPTKMMYHVAFSLGGISVKIQRKRYIVMRRNRTEVWCGLSKNFSFRPVSEIKDVSVKTYRSEAQARSGCSSWDRDFEVVPVIETIETEE